MEVQAIRTRKEIPQKEIINSQSVLEQATVFQFFRSYIIKSYKFSNEGNIMNKSKQVLNQVLTNVSHTDSY